MDKWSPTIATDEIRAMAAELKLTISYKKHAIQQLNDRNLIMSDVLYVLKYGFVYKTAQASTRPGYHKYRMENRSPNSGNRDIRVVVIPDKKTCELKIITVMWVDEKQTVSGSIIGEKDVKTSLH